jgi:hypothetical protein
LNLDYKKISFYKNFKVLISTPQIYDASLNNFPKITNSIIPLGIFDVKYKLNLNILSKFKI